MVQQIDFLPASYRQSQQKRKKKIWRRGVLIVFLAVIVAGAVQQQHARIRLVAQRDRLQREAMRMTGQLENAGTLREEIRKLDVRADLRTLLRVRPASSKVLAAVTKALPRYTTLKEMRAEFQLLEGSGEIQKSSSRSRQKNASTDDSKPAEERDLLQLREEMARRILVVTLEGIAPNDLAITTYMGALEESGLFREVKLSFTDRYEYNETILRQFAITLQVRQPRLQEAEHGDLAPPTSADQPGPVATRFPQATRSR